MDDGICGASLKQSGIKSKVYLDTIEVGIYFVGSVNTDIQRPVERQIGERKSMVCDEMSSLKGSRDAENILQSLLLDSVRKT